MVAVFLILFSACGTAIVNKNNNGDLTSLGLATAGGLSVMMMVFAVGHISGAHLNPAVTIAFASKRIFPLQLVSPSDSKFVCKILKRGRRSKSSSHFYPWRRKLCMCAKLMRDLPGTHLRVCTISRSFSCSCCSASAYQRCRSGTHTPLQRERRSFHCGIRCRVQSHVRCDRCVYWIQ